MGIFNSNDNDNLLKFKEQDNYITQKQQELRNEYYNGCCTTNGGGSDGINNNVIINFRNDMIQCQHYKKAKIFFFIGLLLYFPLIYSIMYLGEPNIYINRYAKGSLMAFILYPSILMLFTFTT